MNKPIFYIISFIFLCNTLVARVPELHATIQEKVFSITINYSDEIILLQKGVVKKYSKEGVFLVSYGNKYINQQTKVISNNTFKTILFCEDYGKIIILDKRFGEIAIIDAFAIENFMVSCVGVSYDNEMIWLWDILSQQLVKINQQGVIQYKSNNINLYTQTTIQPTQIVELATQLYINDIEKGLFVFDNTGTFKKEIPIANMSSFFVKEYELFYINQDCIFSYNPLTFVTTQYQQMSNLNHIQIGQTIIAGINDKGFVEVWEY